MNKYDMGDLKIDEEYKTEKKPKKVLAITALVIIILLAGMMILKSFMGGDSSKNSELKPTKAVDRELEPLNKNPIKVTKRGVNTNDDGEDELKPINDDELPTLPMPKEPKKSENKSSTIPIPSIENNTKSNIKDVIKEEELKKVEEKRVEAPKREVKHRVHKVKPHRVVKHKVVHQKTQPNKLFKRQTHTTKHTKSGKIYYIQVGSFTRQPTKEYLDNIKSKGYHYKFFRSGNLIKVRVGPYSSYNEAKSKLPEIKSSLGLDGFVVRVK